MDYSFSLFYIINIIKSGRSGEQEDGWSLEEGLDGQGLGDQTLKKVVLGEVGLLSRNSSDFLAVGPEAFACLNETRA